MSETPLYPLRFEPIYQYRLWRGRRLANWLTAPLPADVPIGEAWILSDRQDHPSSVEPVLTPSLPQERDGTVANVVFPCGIGRRDDLGLPDRLDIYYGMAGNRIGVARLDVPELLPPGGVADAPEAKV
jgi:hypothetical protein